MFALDRREQLAALWAPLIAAGLAAIALALSLRGVDLPASLYRVDLFHRDGLTLWDSQWYGGHWTLNYSALFPPLAGVLGIGLTEVLCAASAAWAFDRLVVGHFGSSARVGSLIFAIGTLAQIAIGQLPFLLGEALGLIAFWAATRKRWQLALPLALSAALASPLAGAFLALGALAWLLASWPARRLALAALIACALAPVLILSALFPGQGEMPFPLLDFGWLLALFAAIALIIPSTQRALRIAAALYLVAIAASFVLPTPVGGNISRLAECFGAPMAACLLWPQRRRLLIAIAAPLLLMQWVPALATFSSDRSDPSTHAEYFGSLIGFVDSHAVPPGRVEVVPTKLHWEAAYAAPSFALARGWERQLDTADNPIFYTQGALTAPSYRAWLLDNGVRYVALADVQPDYAALGERDLLLRGVPGLRRVWHDAHWQVFAVTGARGVLDGPARLVSLEGGEVTLDALAAGTITVRVHYSPRWGLTQGTGCVVEAPGGWTQLQVPHAGRVQLGLQLGTRSDAGC